MIKLVQKLINDWLCRMELHDWSKLDGICTHCKHEDPEWEMAIREHLDALGL